VPHRAHAASRGSWLSPAHLLIVLRSLWGVVLLTRPRRVGDALGLELADASSGRGVMRVLGGRHLGQAAVTAARPTGPVVAAGAVVDGLHSLTALGWGVLDRSHRRAGLTDAGLAAGFGVAGALVARTVMSTSPGVQTGVADGAAAGGATRPDSRPEPRKDESMNPHPQQTDQPQTDRQRTDRQTDRQQADQPQAKVRPRLMWAGVGLALLGMCGIGWAMIVHDAPGEIAGVVALVVGGLLAWRGGVLNDVQSSQPMSHEVEAAVHGREHAGVEAGEQLHDPEAQARAAELTERKQALLRSRVAAPGPPVRPVATLGLLLLGAWLFVGTFVLPYYYTVTGVNSVQRALGGAIVVTLCALWLRHVGPSIVAAGLAAITGVALVVAAFLLPHGSLWVDLQEAWTGSLVVLASALAAGSRRRG
jgi:hypothetical protein